MGRRKAVETFTETCSACPSQWEGRCTDGSPVYIRYRSSRLTVHFGNPGSGIYEAAGSNPIFLLKTDRGMYDGAMETDEMIRLTTPVLEWAVAQEVDRCGM